MTNSETKNFSQNVSSSYHLRGKCSDECKKDSLNVPKLRFKGYNDEWKHLNFKSITTMIKDGTHGSYNDLSEGIPLLSAKDIDNGKVIIPDDCRRISLSDYNDIYKNYSLKINDILLTIVGTIGRVALVSDITNKYAFQRSVGILRANEYNNPQFILYLLQTDFIKKQFYSKVNQSAQGGIYLDTLGKIDFKIPTLPEQEKIASFLTLIDKKIEKQKELVELLKKYKRGLLSQIFSQKLRFKDENGNNYPDWEEKRLGDICTIIGGGTPDTNNDKYWGDDINWFTPTEIIKKYVDCSNRKISNLGLLKSSAKILPIGTVLLTTRATLGEMSILQIEATTNQGFQSLIPNKNLVTSEFIYYCQPIIKYYCYKYANGSTFLEISKQSLAKLKLKIPYLNEQNKISEYLSKFDNKIQQEESRLNYLQMYKKGLLQQMFI